jgi:radical SAM superfamily enzyme YgiQ (UPF0313 family)
MNLDILLCSIPPIELYLPPAAPAILKGYLDTQGFTSKCVDLNLRMHNLKPDSYSKLVTYFSNENSLLNDAIVNDHADVINDWVEVINQHNIRWLGISIFTNYNIRATLDLCKNLTNRNFKIVVGGMGVNKELADHMLNMGYIDAYINGEGEHALRELLKGNTDYPGINSPGVQITNLDELGFANYDDYFLDQYSGFYNEPVVQITGSRGCVRNCTFCDINDFWPKFKFRSGKHIATEMIKTYEEKNIRNFYFTDSLINGSMSAYMNMCETLAEYNYVHNASIRWGGQYIVRNSKELPKDYYKLTAESGAFNLALGVESGSDSVRNHMRKKFSNFDLDLTLENFAKHRITCSYLILIGYPTETEEDFYDTLRLFKRHQKYVAQGIILGVSLGATMEALSGSPVYKTFQNDISLKNKSFPATWILKSNPELNYNVRIKRRLQAELVADYLGYNLISSDRNFNQLAEELNVLI